MEVEDRLACLEDLAVEGLDLVGERVTEYVSKAAADRANQGASSTQFQPQGSTHAQLPSR